MQLLHERYGVSLGIGDLAGQRPLHLAVLGMHMATTRYLLAQGVCIEHRNKEGKSALELAHSPGHKAIAEELLSYSQRAGVGPTKELKQAPSKAYGMDM